MLGFLINVIKCIIYVLIFLGNYGRLNSQHSAIKVDIPTIYSKNRTAVARCMRCVKPKKAVLPLLDENT